jgi:lysozyme family protein
LLSRDAIRTLQRRLRDLGYVEVGAIDGLVGEKTIGAISMFQAANGLEVNGQLDEETQKRLFTAPMRTIERTAKQIEDSSRIINDAKKVRNVGIGTILSMIGVVAKDPVASLTNAAEWFATFQSSLQPLVDLGVIAMDHWYVPVAAIGVGLYLWSKRIEEHRKEDHETGKTA